MPWRNNKTAVPKLDFIGIGFTKAGSTWVYKLLEEHPDLQVSKTKETNFFVDQDLKNHPDRLRYLEEFFEGDRGRARGEFSPMYVNKDKALENIKMFYPDIKLLVILRNPADKRISEVMYNHRLKTDMEKLDIDRMIRERFEGAPPRFIYLDRLRKWMDNFPPKNFYIMVLEEMASAPQKGAAELYRFLGVNDSYQPQAAKKKVNAAHAFRYPGLQNFLRNQHKRVKKYPRLAKNLKKVSRPLKLKQRILEWNRKEFQKPDISEQTRQMLFNAHRQEIEQLEELLNRDLSVWKRR
jgi:hypothetical protein